MEYFIFWGEQKPTPIDIVIDIDIDIIDVYNDMIRHTDNRCLITKCFNVSMF